MGYSISIISIKEYSFATADVTAMMKVGIEKGPKHILGTKPGFFLESIN